MTELSVNVEGDSMAKSRSRDPAWRRISSAVLALAVAFAVGVAGGYELRGEREPAPVPQRGVEGGAIVEATGTQCAAQSGTILWLGLEVINHGPGPVTLQAINFTLPLGGLEERTGLWGACGQLVLGAPAEEEHLYEGSTVWVSGAFQVQVDCPLPLPVQFMLTYTDAAGATQQRNVGGFPDLGRVPYSGCDTAGTQT
jgi:hypothetical protein